MPGVPVEEGPPGPQPIAGVPTSIAAFIGRARRGPINEPVSLGSAAQFDREFGELWTASTLGYAVHQFFANGGRDAIVVRVFNGSVAPSPEDDEAGASGVGGSPITDAQISAPELEAAQEGLWALEKTTRFTLLCIPPLSRAPDGDISAATRRAAAEYCQRRRAIFIADPLATWHSAADVETGAEGLDSVAWGLGAHQNAALYFPGVRMSDPADNGRVTDFAPCGAVAGVIARTDTTRGVSKAPAGQEATIMGVVSPAVRLNDADGARLNALGVNGVRSFATTGTVVWGARTLAGADRLASEWKYLPVRRTALFIEESLVRGLQWVVFEPNDEPLWAQIRSTVGDFLHGLFRQGAFAGTSPREGYFVKCDRETTTQNDIDQGVVTIVVGFAPLKPAEFVVITIKQLARTQHEARGRHAGLDL